MLNYQEDEIINNSESFILNFKKSFNIMKEKRSYNEIAFICVGTDRITGDCFGPLVGTKLSKLLEKDNFSNVNVYGTLKHNVNYTNIEQLIKQFNNNAKKTSLIVVDSALSKKENIGKIFVSNNKTILGKGLNKNKIEIGDISIKTVVGKDYKVPSYNFKILQNISLNVVMTLADIVANGIYNVIKFN